VLKVGRGPLGVQVLGDHGVQGRCEEQPLCHKNWH